MEKILECNGLTKKYGNNLALNNLNLSVSKGRIVGLLGPNGSGKTTFIKLITGLLTPTFGDIAIDGMPIGVDTKKIVSYLPDHNFLAPWRSVKGMLDYFADFYADFDRSRAEQMLTSLNIDLKSKIKTLSKGNQEKVSLILTMSRRAKLYVLDEPIAAVDPATRDYILRTILTNYDSDATIIISTHLISDIETILNDVIMINTGNLVVADSVENIKEYTGKTIDEYFREVFRC
ncbi:MAG: ABC transporter ATP-binding protein [Clostridia bacterium]|nr:ABC transporter ATP-binding protein [Clostridia bacterium]